MFRWSDIHDHQQLTTSRTLSKRKHHLRWYHSRTKGPKKEQINNYLRHLVDDLIELYNGINMKLHNGQEVNV